MFPSVSPLPRHRPVSFRRSAANVIVSERAAKEHFHNMGFKEFFVFGSWTTIFLLVYGCIPLYALLF